MVKNNRYNYLKIVLLYVFLVVMSACSSYKTDENTIQLKDTSEKMIMVKELISVNSWILLDNTPEASIGDATRIIEHDDRIYILDLTSRKDVAVFDNDGNYLASVGERGNGPGEYTDILDFAVNTDNNEIAILAPSSTIYLYDKDGVFIKSEKLTESLLWHIIYCEGHYICSTDHCTYTEGDEAYLIYRFNSDFKLEGKFIPVMSEQMPSTSMFEGIFSSQGNTAYYMDMFAHSLYEINNDSPSPIMNLSLPNAMPNSVFRDGMTFYMKQTEYDWIKSFFPLPKRFLFTYVVEGHLCLAEISEEGKMLRSGLIGGILPKMFPGLHGSILSPITMEDYNTEWLGKSEIDLKSDDISGNLYLLRWHLN